MNTNMNKFNELKVDRTFDSSSLCKELVDVLDVDLEYLFELLPVLKSCKSGTYKIILEEGFVTVVGLNASDYKKLMAELYFDEDGKLFARFPYPGMKKTDNVSGQTILSCLPTNRFLTPKDVVDTMCHVFGWTKEKVYEEVPALNGCLQGDCLFVGVSEPELGCCEKIRLLGYNKNYSIQLSLNIEVYEGGELRFYYHKEDGMNSILKVDSCNDRSEICGKGWVPKIPAPLGELVKLD